MTRCLAPPVVSENARIAEVWLDDDALVAQVNVLAASADLALKLQLGDLMLGRFFGGVGRNVRINSIRPLSFRRLATRAAVEQATAAEIRAWVAASRPARTGRPRLPAGVAAARALAKWFERMQQAAAQGPLSDEGRRLLKAAFERASQWFDEHRGLSRVKHAAVLAVAVACDDGGSAAVVDIGDKAEDSAVQVDSGGDSAPPDTDPPPCADGDADCDGSLDADDCAPDDPWVSPLAHELCNGVDDNCDGVPEDACDTTMAQVQILGATHFLDYAGFNNEITVLPDIDGDGLDELMVTDIADHGDYGKGIFYLLSGAELPRERATLDVDAPYRARVDQGFYPEAGSPGDVDGDGIFDWLVAGRETGSETPVDLYLYSGAELWDAGSFDGPERALIVSSGLPYRWGGGAWAYVHGLTRQPLDIDGNGEVEVPVVLSDNIRLDDGTNQTTWTLALPAAADFLTPGFGASGATRAISFNDYVTVESAGVSTLPLGDWDGDGLDDLLVEVAQSYSTQEAMPAAMLFSVSGADLQGGIRSDISDVGSPIVTVGIDSFVVDLRPVATTLKAETGTGLPRVAVHYFATEAGNSLGHLSVFGAGDSMESIEDAPLRMGGTAECFPVGRLSSPGDLDGDGTDELVTGLAGEGGCPPGVGGAAGIMSGALLEGEGVVTAWDPSIVVATAAVEPAAFNLSGAQHGVGDITADGVPDVVSVGDGYRQGALFVFGGDGLLSSGE